VPCFTTVPRFAKRRNTVSALFAAISLNAASPGGIPFACMTAAAISADGAALMPFVKMAPVIKALQAHPNMNSALCLTAQHREMLDQVLQIFAIKADFDLDLMQPSQTLNGLS
jgi:hypothetical protein